MFRSLAVPALAALAAFAALPELVAAGIPGADPAHSTIPDWITIVGTRDGTPDPAGIFKVVVRDFWNNPLYIWVEVSLDNCNDARVCTVSYPGLAVPSCSVWHGSVGGLTDRNGEVTLVLVGGGEVSNGTTPGHDQPCVKISAGSTVLGYARARIYDSNGGVGQPGVTGTDLAVSQADFLRGIYVTRSDFDGVPPITGTDLAIHQKVFVLLASSTGCHDGTGPQPYCP